MTKRSKKEAGQSSVSEDPVEVSNGGHLPAYLTRLSLADSEQLGDFAWQTVESLRPHTLAQLGLAILKDQTYWTVTHWSPGNNLARKTAGRSRYLFKISFKHDFDSHDGETRRVTRTFTCRTVAYADSGHSFNTDELSMSQKYASGVHVKYWAQKRLNHASLSVSIGEPSRQSSRLLYKAGEDPNVVGNPELTNISTELLDDSLGNQHLRSFKEHVYAL